MLTNGAMYGHAPDLMTAFRTRRDEVRGHGRTNAKRQILLDPEAEAAEVITQAETVAPPGWLSPSIAESHVTPDLWGEAGYGQTLNWCRDGRPVWMRTRAGGLLSIPYPQEVNDSPAIVARKDETRACADMIIDNFDEMLQRSRHQPLVMGIALHPCLVGQPYRLRALRHALPHVAKRRADIWLTRAGAIPASCRDKIADLIV